MSESPTKKRKDGKMPGGGGSDHPYSRYSQQQQYGHGQPPPPSYGGHGGGHPSHAPPYGGYHQPPTHQPPPPPPQAHYSQSIYPSSSHAPPPSNYQASTMYSSPAQSWLSSTSQSNLYCQSIQPTSSSQPPDGWKGEQNPRGGGHGGAHGSAHGGGGIRNNDGDIGGGRLYTNSHSTQTQTSSSVKNNVDKSSSSSPPPKPNSGWHPGAWHGGGGGSDAEAQHIRHPPPINMWNSSGSPTNWNSGPGGGGGPSPTHRGSPTNDIKYPSNPNSSDIKRDLSDDADKDKGRGSYRCGKCGAPKKGHVCPYQPKFKRRPDEPPPVTKNASTQVEMDEFLVLRRLNLEIQGFPESYTSEPMGDHVGAETHSNAPLVSNTPHVPGGPGGVPPPAMVRNTMMAVGVGASTGIMPPPPPSSHDMNDSMQPMISNTNNPNTGGLINNGGPPQNNEMNYSYPSSSSPPLQNSNENNMSERGTSPM